MFDFINNDSLRCIAIAAPLINERPSIIPEIMLITTSKLTRANSIYLDP